MASPRPRSSISTSPCNELTVPEAAYLAALPKAPNNYHPFRQRERALERRNWVIDQMAEDGFIKTRRCREGARRAARRHARRPTGTHTFAAEYFAEEVRRELYDRYGEKKLYEGGLSVRTTLDTNMQVLARKTLTDGLVQFRRGARLARAGHQDRHRRRLGRQARRREGAEPTSRRGGSRSCWKSAISRRASACSRDASRAASSARNAQSASCRSTA